MDFSIPLVTAAVGAVVLLFGRRLFWLFVAALGFAAGMQLAPVFVHEPTPLLALSVALVLGFVGALLALFLQKIAVAIGGFLAGGQLAVALAAGSSAALISDHLLVFAIGGIVGAILLIAVFNWALIVLSALLGAHLMLGAFTLRPEISRIAFVVLALVGIATQAGMSRRGRVAKS